MAREGLSNLYRGVGPPLVNRTLNMSLMFGSYDVYLKALRARGFPDDSLTSFAAGLLSGTSESLFTPLERIQSLLQHRHFNTRFANTAEAARMLWPYGFREYYRGFTSILLRNAPCSALYFTLKDPVRAFLPEVNHQRGAMGVVSEFGLTFVSGGLLGATLSTVFFPLNVAKSVMQSQIGGTHPSVGMTLRRVYRERGGLAGTFRGWQVNLFRSIVGWGMITSVYDLLSLYTAGAQGGASKDGVM